MAQVNDNLLGNLSGRLGNVVFRKMNGKSFVSVRPKKYKPAKSEQAVKTKNKFGTIVKFAAYINSISELKAIWKSFAEKGKRGYNTIISINQSLIPPNILKNNMILINTNYIIVPGGLDINISGFNYEQDAISISFSLSELIDYPKNINSVKSFFVFCFQEPFENKNKQLKLLCITDESNNINSEMNYSLTTGLSQEIKDLTEKYNSCVIFFSMLFLDIEGNIINWTSSVAKTFELNK